MNKFKKGEVVAAKDTAIPLYLTPNELYLILAVDAINGKELIRVINNRGNGEWFYSSRFVLVDEENE